jgi:hypothetical protein
MLLPERLNEESGKKMDGGHHCVLASVRLFVDKGHEMV